MKPPTEGQVARILLELVCNSQKFLNLLVLKRYELMIISLYRDLIGLTLASLSVRWGSLHEFVRITRVFKAADPMLKLSFIINYLSQNKGQLKLVFIVFFNPILKYYSPIITQYVPQLRIHTLKRKLWQLLFGRHTGLNQSDFKQHFLLQQYKLIWKMSSLTYYH